MTAQAFAAGKVFEPSTLRYWAHRLKGGAMAAKPARSEVRLARVVRTRGVVTETDAPITETDAPIVVEIGGARVAVRRGFNRAVLAAVLDVVASHGGAR